MQGVAAAFEKLRDDMEARLAAKTATEDTENSIPAGPIQAHVARNNTAPTRDDLDVKEYMKTLSNAFLMLASSLQQPGVTVSRTPLSAAANMLRNMPLQGPANVIVPVGTQPDVLTDELMDYLEPVTSGYNEIEDTPRIAPLTLNMPPPRQVRPS
jgi:hypothetical protein